MSERWIAHWLRNNDVMAPSDTLGTRSAAKVDELMGELASPELSELAKVPLLLSLLIFLKLQNVTLPEDRFKAYDELLRHMIAIHPQRRRVTAGISDSAALSPDDAARVLGHLAYTVQSYHSEGAISRADAVALIEKYLSGDEGLGFDVPEARRYALNVVDSEGASSGLLVPRSEQDLGFFHRSLQEYLAAQHLARLPGSFQGTTCRH
jgi:hypothetical protein